MKLRGPRTLVPLAFTLVWLVGCVRGHNAGVAPQTAVAAQTVPSPSAQQTAPVPRYDKVEAPPFLFEHHDFTVDGELGSFRATWAVDRLDSGVYVIHLRLASDVASTPPKFRFKWKVPSVGVVGYWNPKIGVDKVNYYHNHLESRATRNAPVLSLLDATDRNRLTFAVSDALNKLNIGTELLEEDAMFHGWAEFFEEQAPPTKHYDVDILLDPRQRALEDTLSDVTQWWTKYAGGQAAAVPEAARLPVYSTWYNFHQTLDPDVILAELALAKELGYETVIVDDGWQTLDDQRGYAYTGDWIPERIGDMKGFVDRVHQIGLKFVLWYSLPFVGEKAERFQEFRGKYLAHSDALKASTLDPRYPQVRSFIISTYTKALVDWDLDGFKLDFIGRFVANEKTDLTARKGRDYASVNAAVDRLMTDIMAALRAIKPDVMIEFRQPYVGPLMRKYGNMFRAVDCPNNAVVNRVQVADLRLLSGDTAVHSDMFMWHPQEGVEDAALQFQNVLFSVPQLSVRLRELPVEHREMIGFWTHYWRENRAVLLDGKFRAPRPGALYPQLRATRGDKTIVGLYEDIVVEFGTTEVDIVNAKPSARVVVRLGADLGQTNVRTLDALGRETSRATHELSRGVHEFVVPPSGLLEIRS